MLVKSKSDKVNKPTQDKPKAKKFSKNLFSVLKPYKGIVALLIVLALVGSGINLLIPKIIARAIDSFSAGRFDIEAVLTEFLVAAVGVFIFTFGQEVLQTVTAERVARDLRNKLALKISKQTYTYINKANPSKLLTNLTSDLDSLKMFVSQAFVNIVSSLFVIVGASVLLMLINWKLALAVLIIVPIIAVSFYVVFKKVRVIFKQSKQVIDSLNKVINESIYGSVLIRVLNGQHYEKQKFLEKNLESRDLGLSIVRLFSVLVPIIMFVSNLAIVIILVLGGHYVVGGSLSLGNFAAFNSYIAMLIFPVMVIGFMSNIIASATASYERITTVLHEPDPSDTGTVRADLSGAIQLENVELAYDNKPVLKKLSLSISAASKTAIIGPTAAGKSQLLYLLSKLIAPDAGTIRFDGIPIEEYSNELFHKQLGVVFQDSILFNVSLRENIAFNEAVTEADLQKAIETAELSGFIASLPEQLNTNVAERGTSLSGGQKQRIMLARALSLNPKILLLDDFTSRVDKNTEQKILANIQQNYPKLSLISVTQKIDLVADYDQIILLMDGELVAAGTHQELLDHSPEYNQIYSSQKSTQHYEL